MNLGNPLIKKGIIHIWYSPISPWRTLVEELKTLLSEEEILRSENLVFRERREDYIISRGLLRKILAQYLELAPDRISIKINPAGKPYLPGSAYNFNLSHSKDLFLCGITQDTPIGVDLQHIYPISNMDTLIRNYFSPEEQQLIKYAAENQIKDLFFLIWTAKEAFLKGTGEGFRRSARNFTICQKDNGLLSVKIKEGLFPNLSRDWNIQEIQLSPEYKAALAIEREIVHIESNSFLPE